MGTAAGCAGGAFMGLVFWLGARSPSPPPPPPDRVHCIDLNNKALWTIFRRDEC
jgi:hypothetical protein